MKSQIQAVEASYFVHATEDGPRIGAAVAWLLGAAAGPQVESLEGHFGNEILLARYRFTGADASRALSSMASKVPDEVRRRLREEMGALVDEHSALHLRLDKQKLVGRVLDTSESDPVKVKVKPRLYFMKGGAAEFYRRILG